MTRLEYRILRQLRKLKRGWTRTGKGPIRADAAAIAKAANLDEGQVGKALPSLVGDGLVRQEGKSYFSITRSGEAALWNWLRVAIEVATLLFAAIAAIDALRGLGLVEIIRDSTEQVDGDREKGDDSGLRGRVDNAKGDRDADDAGSPESPPGPAVRDSVP